MAQLENEYVMDRSRLRLQPLSARLHDLKHKQAALSVLFVHLPSPLSR